MDFKPKNKMDLEAVVNAKAWKDPKFKKRLLSDPNAALKEMGIDMKTIKIRIVEDDVATVTFVLYPAPKNVGSMSDAELKKVAGGVASKGPMSLGAALDAAYKEVASQGC